MIQSICVALALLAAPPVVLDDRAQLDLIAEHPDVVEQLISLLKRYVDQGRSTPGRPQANDVKVQIVAS